MKCFQSRNFAKKAICLFTVTAMLFGFFGLGGVVTANANDLSEIEFNGVQIGFKTPAINKNGRLFYPLRELVENIGGTVSYDEVSKEAICTYKEYTTVFRIGESKHTNALGETIVLDAVPFIENGKTYLPIRYVYEDFGFSVSYDDEKGIPVVKDKILDTRKTLDINETSDEVFRLVNQEREKEGLSPLMANENLTKAAMIRAQELEILFSHSRPDDTSFYSVLDEFDFPDTTGYAENIAMGQSDPQDVMKSWMNSSGHRANIMDPELSTLGVGCYSDSEGQLYWVQLFLY